jgi:hypothetical protein
MGKRVTASFLSVVIFPALFLSSHQLPSGQSEEILPGHLEYEGWERKEEPEHYEGEGLFGHINGGAEIFLQYGFKDLALGRYTMKAEGKEKEIVLEAYWMESPADAFGIFSVKRAGDEIVSGRIDALNWVSGTQINMAKGEYFVNVVGFECEEEELEEFAAFVARRIEGEVELPGELSYLPSQGMIRGSGKYIRGQLAASADSVLLQKDFWGFKGETMAVSSRYEPSNSKLIIVDFGKEKIGLKEQVIELFEEYLAEIVVKEKVIQGKNSIGKYFLFSHEGDMAVLILGEANMESAQSLLRETRKKIGGYYDE